MTLADPKAFRPRIEMEPSNIETVCGMLAWIGVAASLLTVIYYWPALPASDRAWSGEDS